MTAPRNDPRHAPRAGWRYRGRRAAAALLACLSTPAAAEMTIPAAAGYPDGALRQATGQLVVLNQAFRLCIPELVPAYEATLAAEQAGGMLAVEPYAAQFTTLTNDQQALAGRIQCTQMNLAASLLAQSPDHLMSFVFRNAACVMTALQRLPRRQTLDDETRRQVIAIGEGCASVSAQQAMTDATYRPPAAGPSPHGPTVATPAPAVPPSKTVLPGRDSHRSGQDAGTPAPGASVMPTNPAPPERRRLEMPPTIDMLPVPGSQRRSIPPRPIATVPTAPAPTTPARPATVQPGAADPVRPPFPPPATGAVPAIRELPVQDPAPAVPVPVQAVRPAYRQAPARDPFARDRSIGTPAARDCQFC